MSSFQDDRASRKQRVLITSLPPFRPRAHPLWLSFVAVMCLLLLTETLSNLPMFISQVQALPQASPAQATTSVQKFVQMPQPAHGPAHIPAQISGATPAAQSKTRDLSKLPPTAQPPTMEPITQPLDTTLTTPQGSHPQVQGATLAPLDVVGSDQRLHIQIPRGALDLSQATTATGAAIHLPLTLQVTQLHGNFVAAVNILSTYQLQLLDAQGQAVQSVHLLKPVTFVYHYQPQELAQLDLDPTRLLLSWPDVAQTTRASAGQQAAAKTQSGLAASAATVPMQNDAKAHTLTAQSLVLAAGPLDVGSGTSSNQNAPTPHVASVQGNSGQLSYSYPLQVAPGPPGTTPQLALNYSSEATNERHAPTAPSQSVGEGWSLSLGAITAEVNGGWSAGVGTWYFISGVDHVSERMVPDSTGNSFLTEHLSYVRIRKITSSFGQPCFQAWGTDGTYYAYGCTQDSLQYYTDGTGTRQNYRWDLEHITPPNEGPGTDSTTMDISYLQDQATLSGHTSIRDASIKQITYGRPGTLAGTVDFHYRAPEAQGSWADAYGTNFNCFSPPPTSTPLRCDDPQDWPGGLLAPPVMSTLSLQAVTSYVGDDSSATHKLESYQFSYLDRPFVHSWDEYTQIQQYSAGSHLLTNVTPTAYLQGNGTALKKLDLGYTSQLENDYDDSTQTIPNGTRYHQQSFLYYLNSYHDNQSGVGASISYMTAHENTNGTPVDSTTGDGKFDPFYCDTHTDCTGPYALPDDRTWSTQTVTAITNSGKDSSDPALAPATTSYSYDLATLSGNDVGDTWIPMGNAGNKDADWQAYYHGEFRGFPAVFTTSPANTLTVDGYDSTSGWFTTQGDVVNYTAGSVRQHDVYGNEQQSDWHLINRTVNTYAGDPGTSTGNACNGNYSGVYTPCLVAVVSSRTTTYEQNNAVATSPWVQQDFTYDDFNASGLSYSSTVYHNLVQETTTSSNAPTQTQKWTYQPTDTTINGWVYYNVHKPIHSELDDASGHVWQCQDISYDEGRATGIPAPSAGRVTTQTVHTDCSSPANQTSSALSSYTGYDVYGNAVASVDAFGVANRSIYSTKGCTLTTAPAIITPSWAQSRYTECSTYNSTAAQATSQQNVLQQSTSTSYDATQDALPVSTTNANGQTTSLTYSYDGQGNSTVQAKLPGETGSYSTQSHVSSQCADSSTLPCVEVDTNSSLYAGAVTRTFYDSQGRAVETRTPLDASHDTIAFTVHNDANATTFQSEPFRVPSGSGWLDPNGAHDENGTAPAGTVTAYDAIGRVLATQDAIIGSTTEPGVSCWPLSGVWSSCNTYGVDSPTGGSTLYDDVLSYNANSSNSMTFTDALGRTRYLQSYNTLNVTSTTTDLTRRQETQYNVLGKPTAVIVTDMAPQPGQTITSVTTSVTYNDLGQQLTLSDPDRGTHTTSYDADGRVIKDVSGTRTIGISYDLLGRAICEQDAAPTTDGSGNCSSGSHPLVQNTYDTTKLGTAGSTDFSVGALTQSVSTTYYPDGTSSATTNKVQHDQRGRPITGSLQITVPSSWSTTLPTYQKTQSYNAANQPMTTHTTVGGSAGYTFSQSYDGTTGALLGLSNTTIGNTSLASQSYDLHGQITGLTFLASTGTSLANDHFTYDGDLRPSSTTAAWSASNSTFFVKSLTYDPVGNVISTNTSEAAVSGQSNSSGSEVENFCYDEESRLIWAGNSGTQPNEGSGTSCGTATLSNSLNGASYNSGYAYTYLGQIWQGPLNGTGANKQYLYCSSSQPHQLTGLYAAGTTCANRTNPSYSASYDSWGNETTRISNGTTATLSYDKLDKLVQWNAGSTNQAWYAYNASGGRTLMRSTTSSGTSLTVYAFGLEEHVYNSTGSNVSNTYYYTLGKRLIGKFDGTNTQYYLTDAQGSVLTTFSNAATTTNVLGNQVYGPYGSKLVSSGTMGTSKGYTGQYNDPTGLDYYNARYYDPVVGLFISADTVQGNVQGMDPFAYVSNNPETGTDPTGHCWPLCTAIAGALIGGIIGGVASAVIQSQHGGKINWGAVGAAAAGGALVGALIGTVGPVAFAAGAALVGGASIAATAAVTTVAATTAIITSLEVAGVVGTIAAGSGVLADSLGSGRGIGTGQVTYSRVQGGTPPNVSRNRILVNGDGSITIPNKRANLNVSIGDEHASYFQGIRGDGSEVVKFNLPEWFDNFVKESAIRQSGYKSNPLNQGGTVPKLVDPTTPGTSYEFPAPWISWIEELATDAE